MRYGNKFVEGNMLVLVGNRFFFKVYLWVCELGFELGWVEVREDRRSYNLFRKCL